MSREEGELEKHRVIMDLTYPSDRSIYAYIVKNRDLNITTAFLVAADEVMPTGVLLSIINVCRAHNFFSPLDWPLLCST